MKVRGSTHIIDLADGDIISILNKNRQENFPDTQVVVLDFTRVDVHFFNLQNIVVLACLIEEYIMQGAAVEFIVHDQYGLRYLEGIRFFEYWTVGFNRNRFTNTHFSNTLCLWHISPEMIHAYSDKARDYFERNFFRGKNLEPLYICLTEVFNNVFDHANSPVHGYVITQYSKSSRTFETAVFDLGNGISETVNRHLKATGSDPVNDNQAVELALKRNFSAKSKPHNRGYGLDTLSSIVQTMGGELAIRCNFAHLHLDPKGITREVESLSLPGTLITFTLNADRLEELEEESTDSIFDF